MGKSLQIVVNDWKRLFADQCSVLDTKPAQKSLPADTYSSFGYIAPTLDCGCLFASLECAQTNARLTIVFSVLAFSFFSDVDQAGQNVQLLVTYIPSPADGTFYALDDSRKDVIRNSLTTLQQMPKDFLTKAPPAGAVFAVYLDNVWHRAICNMPAAAGSDTAELYLLDMGETLAYSDLLPKAKLPSDLCQLPAYAIKCQVSHTADGNVSSLLAF